MKDLETMQREGQEKVYKDIIYWVMNPSAREAIFTPKEANDVIDQHTANTWKAAIQIDRDQAYTSLIEGIEGMKSDPTLPVDDALYSRSDIDRQVDKTLTDIIENVVKPLYGKK